MEPFIGQISIVGFDFAPDGWALCNGQAMSIAQNQALFAILGTTFGGDGISTFLLPDLRGRAASHFGTSVLGAMGGQETVTLTQNQLGTHTHLVVNALGATANQANPSLALWAIPLPAAGLMYTSPANIDGSLAMNAINSAGSGQPHENMHPSLVVNFIIALQGIFPTKN